VNDCIDNCGLYANPGQEDADGDGYGDLCDLNLHDLSLGYYGTTLCARRVEDDLGICFRIRAPLRDFEVFGRLLLVPVDLGVYGVWIPWGPGAQAVYAGYDAASSFTNCVLGSDEEGSDWECGGVPEDDLPDRRYVGVAQGDEFCTLRPDGRARCRWRDHPYSSRDYLTPESFSQAATAYHTVCGIRADDSRLVCREIWFWNTCVVPDFCDRLPEHPDCRCGSRPDDWSISGRVIADGVGDVPETPMRTLSVTREYGCGITRDTSEVLCWGHPDDEGMLEAPEGPHIAVNVSEEYACAIDAEHQVECWNGRRRWRLPVPMREIQTRWEWPCGIDMTHNVRCFF
jgi:hypothetical protein